MYSFNTWVCYLRQKDKSTFSPKIARPFIVIRMHALKLSSRLAVISAAEGAIRLMGQSPWITLIHKACELICCFLKAQGCHACPVHLVRYWGVGGVSETKGDSKGATCSFIHSFLFKPFYPGGEFGVCPRKTLREVGIHNANTKHTHSHLGEIYCH